MQFPINLKKVFFVGLTFVALGVVSVRADFHLEKAKVDEGEKEVMFLLNRGNGKDLYWVDAFVDDSDPKQPKVIRALRKVEKNFDEEYEKYLARKKAQKKTTAEE